MSYAGKPVHKCRYIWHIPVQKNAGIREAQMQCLGQKGHIFKRFYIHSYILPFLLLELILIFSHIWDLRELRSGLNDACYRITI